MEIKGIKATGGLAAMATMLTLGLSACQQHTEGAANPVAASSSANTSAAAPSSKASSQAATPGDAVSAWVTQVLQEKYVDACKTSVAIVAPSTSCTDDGNNDVISAFKHLHEAWAKPGVTLPPKGKVEVAKIDAKGDSATVPDTAVKVDGKTLRDLELIGSSGNTSSFKLDLKTQKKDGVWYVSDMHISA
ncbi:hypothetical protein [Amycolatopsis pigmentata]|uniref:Mce-associated membrane protein n=1 Tax=Amycolatopsis pigmentata TaxID=450801 RepID=A0ABW5FZT1_9PSEU